MLKKTSQESIDGVLSKLQKDALHLISSTKEIQEIVSGLQNAEQNNQELFVASMK